MLTTGTEVDFVIGNLDAAIEVKGTSRVTGDHLKGLRELKTEYPRCGPRFIICLETHRRTTEDGIVILPFADFIQLLYDGKLF